jgi:hypothetical protein
MKILFSLLPPTNVLYPRPLSARHWMSGSDECCESLSTPNRKRRVGKLPLLESEVRRSPRLVMISNVCLAILRHLS